MNSKTDQAQELLEQLRKSYLRDLPAAFDDMEALILKLRDSDSLRDNFEELYRSVHSMKGTAGTYGLHIYTNICHQFEDFLNTIGIDAGEISPDQISKLLAYIDLMRETHTILASPSQGLSDIEDRLADLNQARSLESRKALVVENSRATRLVCGQLLEELGYFVVVTGDGKTALERMLHEKFDLLVCGQEIPELNGLALVAAIRLSAKSNAKIPAVLISAKKVGLIQNVSPDIVLSRDQHFAERFIEFVKGI